MIYLRETLPRSRAKGTKGDTSFPRYGITYESLIYGVGLLEKQVHLIDVRHYNAYLLMPRLVYHLSTKLKSNVIHNHIGQIEEVKLIKFLTKYGYATRANPYCKRFDYGMSLTDDTFMNTLSKFFPGI
jgi:hypothetical protein